jgi:hypothetical protein
MEYGLQGTMLRVLIGVPFGIFASFAAWWLVFNWFTPKIEFSNFISAVPSSASPQRRSYRVKFRNGGRRAILDLEVSARLYLPSVNARPIENVIELVLSMDRIPYMDPESKPEILRLELHRTSALASPFLAPSIRGEFATGLPTLETILASHADARVQVLVFGYDAFSGSRKLLRSGEYRRDDVHDGFFERGASLELTTGSPTDEQRAAEGTTPMLIVPANQTPSKRDRL